MAHHRKRNSWLLLAFLVATGLALGSLLRDPTDLAIYLAAARDLVAGDVDIYRTRAGMGPYSYPHFFLLPLAALQALLPDIAIRVLWGIGLGVATAWLFAGLRRATALALALAGSGQSGNGMPAWRWAVLLFLFVRCISSNLTNAQLSLWVSAMTLHGIVAIAERRDLRGGAFVGAAAALKLTPALLLVLLPVMGRARAGVAGVVTAAVLVVLLPWPFLGTKAHFGCLQDFHDAVIAPVRSGERDAPAGALTGPSASIGGTLDYLLQPRPRNAEGRVLAFADLGDTALTVVKLLYGIALAAVAGLGFLRARALPAGKRILAQSSFGMLAMVLFSPLSRTYHLSGILLPAALFCMAGPGHSDWLWWTTAAAMAFSTTLRQKSLLGHELWWTLDNIGLLHLALAGLLGWLTTRFVRSFSPGAKALTKTDSTVS